MSQLHETIVQQLGGKGINGALAYTGTSKVIALDKYTTSFVVNGKPETTTIIHVRLSPKDLYDLYIREVKEGEISYRAQLSDVYGEDLQPAFEQSYDEYIKTRCDGFITI